MGEMDFRGIVMGIGNERRAERRLRYHWPIWFAEDFSESLLHGQLVDVSSSGAAFTYKADERCPYAGQQLTARFSIPCFGPEDSFDLANFARSGHVCRVDKLSDFVRRIVIQFAEPLPFRPGEQAESEFDTQQKLKAVTI
jgi:hypothetical protein